MPDLDVVAILSAKPGSEQALADIMQALVPPTRAEPGCVSYDLFTSGADATTFITVEKWLSQADLDNHLSTPHVQQALEAAAGVLSQPPAIHPLRALS